MIVDFPTFGIPQIINHIPTVANFADLNVFVIINNSLKLILSFADVAIH
jgi:hypothetical protein